MKTPPTLYAVKNHTGAHVLTRTTEAHHEPTNDTPTLYACLYLIGGGESFTVRADEIAPFTMEAIYQGGDMITALAQEAAVIYGADPARVDRAASLARNPYQVQQARRGHNGEKVTPSLNLLCVQGSKGGWYLVSHGKCQCEDHKRGEVCKHRIAAWMHREAIIRRHAELRRTTPAAILAELNAESKAEI